jgi:hypothetical protein
MGLAAGLPAAYITSDAAVAAATPSPNVFNQIAQVAGEITSGAAAAVSDVAKGNLGAAVSQIGQTASQVATTAEQAAKEDVANAGQDIGKATKAIGNAVADAVNGVVGAIRTLVALAMSLNFNGLLKMIEQDFEKIASDLDKTMTRAFGKVTIPSDGRGMNGVFPKDQRGKTITWVNARKAGPADVLHYLATLAIVDAGKLKDEIGKDLGIKLP